MTEHDAITRLAQKLNVLQLARMVGHRDIRSLQTYYNETAESMARCCDQASTAAIKSGCSLSQAYAAGRMSPAGKSANGTT